MTYKELQKFLTENGIKNVQKDLNLASGSKKIYYWNKDIRHETGIYRNENGKLTKMDLDKIEKHTGLQISTEEKNATLDNFKREQSMYFDRIKNKETADRLHQIHQSEKDKPMTLAQKIIAQRRQMMEKDVAGQER